MADDSDMRTKLIELENNQFWCAKMIHWLLDEVSELRNSSEKMERDGSPRISSPDSIDHRLFSELNFEKVPDRSFLGLSKSKAYCTIIPKSSVNQDLLLDELEISRNNKQSPIRLIDENGQEYPAQVRCAYQDRNKTWKLNAEDLKPAIRILLEFKQHDATRKWFSLRLEKSILAIESGENVREKVIFQYLGNERFSVTFE